MGRARANGFDEVRFWVEVQALGMGDRPRVAMTVNGQRLEELAARAEQPYADAEGSPALARSHAGLRQERVATNSLHFLGEPEEDWFGDGDTALLGCVCGDTGCWPLTASVVVMPGTVTWRRFRTGHRDWDLSTLGPFTFARGQYEQALRTLAA